MRHPKTLFHAVDTRPLTRSEGKLQLLHKTEARASDSCLMHDYVHVINFLLIIIIIKLMQLSG